MNKGECGELLALAHALCEFSIAHADGDVELSLVAVGKGFDRGKKVRILVRDKEGNVYANNYSRYKDEKDRIVLPVPRITKSSTKMTMPPSGEFRRTIKRAVKAVATTKNFEKNVDVKAVLDQLDAWGFPLKAANASSKEDIYLGSYYGKPVRGVSVKTHGIAGDSALLNASKQTRCLWRVDIDQAIADFPFPWIRGPDGKAIKYYTKNGELRFRTKRNWIRKSMRALKDNGAFKLILPTEQLIQAAPLSLMMDTAGTSFIEMLGSDQSRLLAACSFYRYTDPPKKRSPNVKEIARTIFDNVLGAEFAATIGMSKPTTYEMMTSHLKTALMGFARGLTPKSAEAGWAPESAVGGIAFLSFDKRDDGVYFRWFDPGQDEKQVRDFSVDAASPDTASTQRHEFGFIWNRRGGRFDHDAVGEINKFNANGDALPAGRYYTYTIMAYRHRPDEVIFKKDYLDRWRAQHRSAKKKKKITIAEQNPVSTVQPSRAAPKVRLKAWRKTTEPR